MSADRRTRMRRVLDARRGAADKLEVDLACLTRDAAQAEQEAMEARRAWLAATSVAVREHCSSGDLAEAHGYAASLAQVHDALVRSAARAKDQQEVCRLRLCAARTEVRKLEVWHERVTEEGTLDEARSERRATDDVAARLNRTG